MSASCLQLAAPRSSGKVREERRCHISGLTDRSGGFFSLHTVLIKVDEPERQAVLFLKQVVNDWIYTGVSILRNELSTIGLTLVSCCIHSTDVWIALLNITGHDHNYQKTFGIRHLPIFTIKRLYHLRNSLIILKSNKNSPSALTLKHYHSWQMTWSITFNKIKLHSMCLSMRNKFFLAAQIERIHVNGFP